ncbi:MAG: efflux RND transporter permease subunit, partial [Planctomycetes bacterium]|nr:efflux RND transporter permease subunit [Planctomycetota bacterium]
MKVSRVAIDRPVLTLVLGISTVFFGAIGYAGMGLDLYPEIELPVVTVTAALEGASPEVVELSLTKVIEDEVATLDRIESITSRSAFGTATVIVEFTLERDIDVAVQEVRDRVAAAQRFLPEDMDPPIIQKINIADQPILWLSASTTGDYWTMARWADRVAEDRLAQLEGVGAVVLGAFRNRAYRVWLDPLALAARGLDPADVAEAIRAEHVEAPAGRAEGPRRDVTLRVMGEFESAEALGALILRGGARPVRLRDVATVEAGLEDATSLAMFNGRPALGLGVRKQSGANTVAVAERVKAALADLQASAPPGVEVGLAFDASRFIRASITGVQFDLVFGAVLTVLVVSLFLRSGRATLITAVAIPTSIVSTFALMQAAGFTMNNVTMLGLSLAVGLVIDDAIVVVENVYRHLEEGLRPVEAARAAMGEIGFAVVVTTISLVAVFVPIAYMRGLIGRFFFQFGLTVSFALIVSTVIALTLAPMLASRLLRRADQDARRHDLPAAAAAVGLGLVLGGLVWRLLGGWREALLVALAFAAFAALRPVFERAFAGLEARYRAALPHVLRRRGLTVVVAGAAFVGAMVLAGSPLVAKEFARQADEGRFLVRFEAPLGTSLEATHTLAREVDAILGQQPEIATRFVASGFGIGAAPQGNTGVAFVNMVPLAERARTQQQVMAVLRAELNRVAGLAVFVDVISPFAGGQRTTDVQYVLRGPDLARLAQAGVELEDRLEALGGYVGVDVDLDLVRPEARVRLDRERAELLGVSARRVTDVINTFMGGQDVAFLREEGDRYDVRLRAQRDLNVRPQDLLNMPVRSQAGGVVALGNVVAVEEGVGPNVITRYDRQRSATLYANLVDKPLGQAVGEVEAAIAAALPDDGLYGAVPAGQTRNFRDAFRLLAAALGLSLVIVYLVLAAQFESFLHPLTILAGLPLAATGVVLGLALTGLSLDVFSFIGVIMLVGIVAKNGILLVDLTQRLRAQGLPRDEALRRAAPVRLRPIVMTAVTTAAGMVPVALAFSAGGETRASMGVAVIAGMLSATPLTLLVLPSVYALLDDAVAWAAA